VAYVLIDVHRVPFHYVPGECRGRKDIRSPGIGIFLEKRKIINAQNIPF
jgi:hypothetical protein